MHIFVHENWFNTYLLLKTDETKESDANQILVFTFKKFDSISEYSEVILRFTERGTLVFGLIVHSGQEREIQLPC